MTWSTDGMQPCIVASLVLILCIRSNSCSSALGLAPHFVRLLSCGFVALYIFALPFFYVYFDMAAIAPVNDVQFAAYIGEHAEAELAFVLGEVGMPLPLQYLLVHAGYRTVRLLASIEDTKAAVRVAFKDILGVDPAADAEARMQMSLLVLAWDIAQASAKKEIEVRAEAKSLGVQRPVTHNDRLAMRRLLQSRVGAIPDAETPGAAYITTKLEEVELNDPQASPLDEIAHLEHSTDCELTVGVDPQGAFRTVRKKLKVDIPATPEQYRMRMRVESNLWQMIASKFTNRSWLTGLTSADFNKFVDYVLGRKVLDIETGTSGDGVTHAPKPSWSLVLSYEYHLRKAAFRMIREEGTSLSEALALVVKDAELRNLFFTTPLLLNSALGGTARRSSGGEDDDAGNNRGKRRRRGLRQPPAQAPPQPPAQQDNKGKGKGKGGKGGKGDKGNSKLVDKTPDGREFCYRFNTGKPCDGRCGRVHACRVRGCNALHAAVNHV